MIGPQKILPVNSQPQSSGQGAKANGIVQTQQPQQSGAWILADNGTLYMNGIITPSGGGLNQIIAQDSSCSVTCNNGGNLTVNSNNGVDIQSNGGINLQDNAEGTINIFVNNGVINTQCDNMYLTGDDSVNLNTNTFNINTYLSSQYYIVYGQSKGEAAMSEQYHTPFPNPEIGQPDFNLRMFGYPDFQEWFDNDQYNRPDNSFMQAGGSNFSYVCPPGTMVDVEITFQLLYTFDGASLPTCYLCCGLFDTTSNIIVPQSINWQQMNDIKFKWVTFKTNFTMRADDHLYFPFFYNQNHDQLSDTETGGLQRSSIKFKFYQFITY